MTKKKGKRKEEESPQAALRKKKTLFALTLVVRRQIGIRKKEERLGLFSLPLGSRGKRKRGGGQYIYLRSRRKAGKEGLTSHPFGMKKEESGGVAVHILREKRGEKTVC